jgi:hypothetical protein
MKTVGATALLTSPAGKYAHIAFVVVRNATASLAGGTDYSIDGWRPTFDLSGLTSPTDGYMVVQAIDLTMYTHVAPASLINFNVNTGSSASANATIDVFGYLS